jgi:DNA polymerase II small subunit/DNA polymerase delta subunit B
MSNTVKYIIAAVVAVIVIVVLYFLFKGGSSGSAAAKTEKAAKSNYVADALDKLKTVVKSTYKESDINWGDTSANIVNVGIDYQKDGAKVIGFFKGLNVTPKGSFVVLLENEIKAYLKSGYAVAHWDIQTGALLNS